MQFFTILHTLTWAAIGNPWPVWDLQKGERCSRFWWVCEKRSYLERESSGKNVCMWWLSRGDAIDLSHRNPKEDERKTEGMKVRNTYHTAGALRPVCFTFHLLILNACEFYHCFAKTNIQDKLQLMDWSKGQWVKNEFTCLRHTTAECPSIIPFEYYLSIHVNSKAIPVSK